MKTKLHYLALFSCFSFVAMTGYAPAATMNWGDISDPSGSVEFIGVTENNGEPSTLFAPEAVGPTASGNMLIFNPQNFQSQSNGGAHLIDSTMTLMITADADAWLSEIRIEEFGDYSLGGLRGGEAFASVGASFFWTVAEVNNAPVSLPLQVTELVVNSGGFFERPGDDGTARPWLGSAILNIDSLLADNGIVGSATKINLTFDNTLQTAADNFSNAFIKKKGVKITVDTHGVPEPAAATLALLGLSIGLLRRNSRA